MHEPPELTLTKCPQASLPSASRAASAVDDGGRAEVGPGELLLARPDEADRPARRLRQAPPRRAHRRCLPPKPPPKSGTITRTCSSGMPNAPPARGGRRMGAAWPSRRSACPVLPLRRRRARLQRGVRDVRDGVRLPLRESADPASPPGTDPAGAAASRPGALRHRLLLGPASPSTRRQSPWSGADPIPGRGLVPLRPQRLQGRSPWLVRATTPTSPEPSPSPLTFTPGMASAGARDPVCEAAPKAGGRSTFPTWIPGRLTSEA